MSKTSITSEDLAAWEMSSALQGGVDGEFLQKLRARMVHLGTLGKTWGRNRCDCCGVRTRRESRLKPASRVIQICDYCLRKVAPPARIPFFKRGPTRTIKWLDS